MRRYAAGLLVVSLTLPLLGGAHLADTVAVNPSGDSSGHLLAVSVPGNSTAEFVAVAGRSARATYGCLDVVVAGHCSSAAVGFSSTGTDETRATLVALQTGGNASTAGCEAFRVHFVSANGCIGVAAASGGAAACQARDACAALSLSDDATSCGFALVCASASGTGDAAGASGCNGSALCAAISGYGSARGNGAISVIGSADCDWASFACIAGSGTGDAEAGDGICVIFSLCAPGLAVSGTGDSSGPVAISGTGKANGPVAVGVCHTAGVECPNPAKAEGHAVFPPIAIDGDTVLGVGCIPNLGVGVVGGCGTKEDPYVIAGWRILHAGAPEEGSGIALPAIRIADTTHHLVLKDIIVDTAPSVGLELVNVTNLVIDSVSVTDSVSDGIRISGVSSSVRIFRTRVESSGGFGVSAVGEIGVTDSRIAGNGAGGITIIGGDPTFANVGNSIQSNLGSGVEVCSSSVLNWTGNWWGDASGPAGLGSGAGNPITKCTQGAPPIWTPWLTDMP